VTELISRGACVGVERGTGSIKWRGRGEKEDCGTDERLPALQGDDLERRWGGWADERLELTFRRDGGSIDVSVVNVTAIVDRMILQCRCRRHSLSLTIRQQALTGCER